MALFAVPKALEDPFWYALAVKPRHEKLAAEHLRLRSQEEFLPLYRSKRLWSDRKKYVDLPLFPGYVFCRFGYRDRLDVLKTPGVMCVVGFGGQDIPLAEGEIAAIREILSSGLPVMPYPYLRVGDRVAVRSGALTGLEGLLVREKSCLRVVVNVDLLDRSVAVEIDREMLEPLANPARRAAGMRPRSQATR